VPGLHVSPSWQEFKSCQQSPPNRSFFSDALRAFELSQVLMPKRESPSMCSSKGFTLNKVGATGFEPATSWSQNSRRTTKSLAAGS